MFRDRKKGFFFGALLGTIAGGILAMLYTPRSGKETRKEWGKKYRNGCDKAKDMFDQVGDDADQLIDKAKSIAKNAKSLASSAKDAACAWYDKNGSRD